MSDPHATPGRAAEIAEAAVHKTELIPGFSEYEMREHERQMAEAVVQSLRDAGLLNE